MYTHAARTLAIPVNTCSRIINTCPIAHLIILHFQFHRSPINYKTRFRVPRSLKSVNILNNSFINYYYHDLCLEKLIVPRTVQRRSRRRCSIKNEYNFHHRTPPFLSTDQPLNLSNNPLLSSSLSRCFAYPLNRWAKQRRQLISHPPRFKISRTITLVHCCSGHVPVASKRRQRPLWLTVVRARLPSRAIDAVTPTRGASPSSPWPGVSPSVSS